MTHVRPRLAAIVAAVATLLSSAGLMVATAPQAAAAVTCPTGSLTFNTEPDANGNQIVQNADNFGGGSDTCFTFAAGGHGQATITQADPANHVNPTSYPNDGYGCSLSYCSTGWASQLWSTPTMTISGAIDSTGVATGSKYDLLIDSLFTTSTGTFSNPTAEVEIVTMAAPSYTGLGFCAATTCGAKAETIDGSTWWLKYKVASAGWDDYVFVRGTMSGSFSGLTLHDFYTAANTFAAGGHGAGLGTLNLGTAEMGTEFWENGLGMKLSDVSATNVP